MKSDPRVRYTESVIEKAMIELLKDNPPEKITVRMISETAMINRGTFYKHYQDIYDLSDRMKEKELKQFEEMLKEMKTNGAGPVITAILNGLKENRDLLRAFSRQGEENDFVTQLSVKCFRFMDEEVENLKEKNLDERQKKAVITYITGGSASVIRSWLSSGCGEPAEKVAEEILNLSGILLREIK
ncbi:MAG: TetR/AcrR family transcriptional regulator [Erysipelotrichaceae bacterium]|nr:TetR/AcrR family transcriptional regulator [Erysipelotrichaceae bacterium]